MNGFFRSAGIVVWHGLDSVYLVVALSLAVAIDASAETMLPELDVDSIRSPVTRSKPAFMAGQILLDGNTVLDPVDVAAVTDGFVGRPLTDADLQALREALSLLYVNSGYVNSGVVVPNQQITAGQLRLLAVEGALSAIELEGDPRLRDDYIINRLRRQVADPLNVQDLSRAIQLLQKDPNIVRVDAHLEPGIGPGESLLRLSVDEAPRWMAYLHADNQRSEAIGAEQVIAGLSNGNLSGRGDRLVFEAGISEGSDALYASYWLPLNSRGVAAGIYYSRDDVDVVEQPFKSLDITTDSETYGLAVDIPLLDGLQNSLSLDLGFEVVRSNSELGGIPFSLSSGAIEGESRLSVGIVGMDWVRRADKQVFALRGTLRRGFDILDATDALPTPFDPTDTDAEFYAFLGQAQWVRRLRADLDLAMRTTFQLADDSLMGVEKLAIGGVNTVRGYRENLLVRDNGLAASVELRWRPFEGSDTRALRSLSLVSFVDYGRSWDEQDVDVTSQVRDTSDAAWIVGAGVGFDWHPIEGVDLTVYWGSDVETGFSQNDDPRDATGDHGLQDDGIHFAVTVGRSF